MKYKDTSIESKIEQFCNEYFVPKQYLIEILEDQKVVPMIRGKASEYNAYLYLKNTIEEIGDIEWDVQKLNLNAQNNNYDEDISLTHRRTGIRLKVEVKNAVRGSFNVGKRTSIKEPHFKVKCHRSRSNLSKAETTNDRYIVGEFDLLMTNTLNALYENGTINGLQVQKNEALIDELYKFYHVNTISELIAACNSDWRIVIPKEIAKEDNTIDRTPYVILSDNEPHWKSVYQFISDGDLLRALEIKMKK